MVGAVCLLLLALPVLWPGLSLAAAGHHPELPDDRLAALLSDKGRHHHPIATSNPEAQRFFDQGMTLLFGFNHAEAVRSFRRAADLDPKAAMLRWGIALALGPHYNRDIDPIDEARNKAAYDAVQKALSLAAEAPRHEQAYIKALAKRYSIDPKADVRQLEVDYKDAMAELKRAYPDDPDAAALYAESLMNLRPWQLWSPDGTPAEGTEEAVRVLEELLRRFPDHIGANHYYIHVMEASPHPERALPSAARLMHMVPWLGHLVHMPSHIYMHTGDYDLLAQTNELAAKADEDYFSLTGSGSVYRSMLYTHNVHFIAVARVAEGRFEEAKRAAEKLTSIVRPDVERMPMLEAFVQVPIQVQLRFHRWDEILNTSAPDLTLPLSRAFRHYGRALAFWGKGMTEDAARERRAFESVRKEIPADAIYAYNTVEKVLGVAAAVLEARLADDPEAAIEHWRRGVTLEDGLAYGEPPDWYYPVRESLGAALLRAGRPAQAEQVFREDLRRNRRNGRSLFGLVQSLKAQGKSADAEWVRIEFERAWKGAIPLRIEDL